MRCLEGRTDLGGLAHDLGKVAGRRAIRQDCDPEIAELIQAERLVECFEAESWSGTADDEGIRLMAQAGWEASHVPPLVLEDSAMRAIRAGIPRSRARTMRSMIWATRWRGCARFSFR